MGPVSLSGQYEGAPRRRAVELRAHCSAASVVNEGGGAQGSAEGRSTSASSATVGLGYAHTSSTIGNAAGTPGPAEPVRSSVRCDVHARARARCLPYRLHHAVRSCVCLSPLRRLAPPCLSPSPPPPRCVPATDVQAACKHALSALEARRAMQTAHRCQWLMKASSPRKK